MESKENIVKKFKLVYLSVVKDYYEEGSTLACTLQGMRQEFLPYDEELVQRISAHPTLSESEYYSDLTELYKDDENFLYYSTVTPKSLLEKKYNEILDLYKKGEWIEYRLSLLISNPQLDDDLADRIMTWLKRKENIEPKHFMDVLKDHPNLSTDIRKKARRGASKSEFKNERFMRFISKVIHEESYTDIESALMMRLIFLYDEKHPRNEMHDLIVEMKGRLGLDRADREYNSLVERVKTKNA